MPACVPDVSQNDFFAEIRFDQLDHILNGGREIGRGLGQAIDSRC